MKNLRKASGITLIALVITIVVLIILATVSINMVLDKENGILRAADRASKEYQEGEKKEQGALTKLEEEINKHIEQGKTENVTMVKSEDNQEVPVPRGYVASTIEGEKSVSTGFVIKKGDNGAATEGVNEFVWVPVSEESFNEMFATESCKLSGKTGVKTEYYSKLRIINGFNAVNYTATKPGDASGTREPDLATTHDDDSTATLAGYANLAAMAQGFVDDYKNMRESIKKYGGFYIGRYELSGTVDNPTVQSGEVLTALSSQAGNWYGLYKASKNVAKEGEKVTSTMIWGCQWDETMDWIKNTKFKGNSSAIDLDSSSWGNYSSSSGDAALTKEDGTNAYGSPQKSGYSKEYWSANNICDLAGNCFEFTQEAHSSMSRVLRGGSMRSMDTGYPATGRNNTDPKQVNGFYSTRVTLYINP